MSNLDPLPEELKRYTNPVGAYGLGVDTARNDIKNGTIKNYGTYKDYPIEDKIKLNFVVGYESVIADSKKASTAAGSKRGVRKTRRTKKLNGRK